MQDKLSYFCIITCVEFDLYFNYHELEKINKNLISLNSKPR